MLKNFGLKLAALVIGLFVFGLNVSTVAADCDNPSTTQEAIQCGTNNSAGIPTNAQNPSDSLNTSIHNGVNVLSVIVGVVAVLMIIVGGFRYIASGGKQESVTTAKNTILYALIGLIIVALAQVIVHFVYTKTNNITSSSSSSSSGGSLTSPNGGPCVAGKGGC